jgi:isopentenyl-diphosphate Delta-isomerase
MSRDHVIVVDINDHPISKMEKMEAHLTGTLHRAFSVFIFNRKGQMLLQKRAAEKYHGAGLWTNACCSHPQWNENTLESAHNRLDYEMGLQCDLQFVYSFIYRTPVENNLIEHEYDHIFIGYTDDVPFPNPNEVEEYKWIDLPELEHLIKKDPEEYTYWFKMILPKISEIVDAR